MPDHTLYGKFEHMRALDLSTNLDTGLFSGVARAFPGGRVAHPEGQNEEENK